MHLQHHPPGLESSSARRAVPMAPCFLGPPAMEGMSVAPWFCQGSLGPRPGDITQPAGGADEGRARPDPLLSELLASLKFHPRLAEFFLPTKEAAGAGAAGGAGARGVRSVFARGCVHEPVEEQGCPRRGGESVLRPPTAAPAEGARVSPGRPALVSTAVCVCVCVCVSVCVCVWRMDAPTCVCWGLWFCDQ